MHATWIDILSGNSAEDLYPEAAVPSARELISRLSVIWQEVLPVEAVEPTDNFFDLGGHSIFAAQIVARIRDELALDLPVRVVFDYPNVADMAVIVGRMLREESQIFRPRLALRKRNEDE